MQTEIRSGVGWVLETAPNTQWVSGCFIRFIKTLNKKKRKTKIVASKIFNHGSQTIWKRSNDHL
jgi:hypothetical protein